MAEAYRDGNDVPTLIASSNVDGKTPVRLYADPITHRLLVDSTGGGGGGVNIEAGNGTVNGTNLVFTFTNEPKTVSIDGLMRRDGKGYVLSGSGPYTITVDPLTAPYYDVFSIY